MAMQLFSLVFCLHLELWNCCAMPCIVSCYVNLTAVESLSMRRRVAFIWDMAGLCPLTEMRQKGL